MGKEINYFSLNNGTMEVVVSDYGCKIVAIMVPDREGRRDNIVAGFKDPQHYFTDHPYFGSTVGRFAGRIAQGKFRIGEKEYTLPLNMGADHLHGGVSGFSHKYWQKTAEDRNSISFSYTSADGEEGYPGTLRVRVGFVLSDDNVLSVNYQATTNADTILNLTNHAYFNLSGFVTPTIRQHELQILSDRILITDERLIPTGALQKVEGTPYDFNQPKKIGDGMDALNGQGYDTYYVLRNSTGLPSLGASLYDPGSGRLMQVFTDTPGIQVYTANGFDGSLSGWQGVPYEPFGAIALETQGYPDAPNHPEFPGTLLRPGETFISTTSFQFSTR